MKPNLVQRKKYNLKHDPNEGIISNELEFEYPEVLSAEFTRVLDSYDCLGVSADQHIKQEFNSLQQSKIGSKGEANNFENPQDVNILNMYNILKRMLVKKKYAMHTIRLENISKRNRTRRSVITQQQQQQVQQQQKTRPVTAGTQTPNNLSPSQAAVINEPQSNAPKLNRPKTVNVVPVKLENINGQKVKLDEQKASNEIKSDNGMPTRTPFTLFEEECLYEQFRLSPTTIKSQMWPYELEFDKFTKKKSTSSNSKKNPKCFPCKKLPLVKVELPIEAELLNPFGISSSQQFKSKYSFTSSKPVENENLKSQLTHLNQTYNSLRRSVSGKLSVQNPPIRSYLRISMNRHSNNSNIDQNDPDQEDENDFENNFDDEDAEVEINLLRKNIQVNKEEQMRKMNLLPGKTFRSQRTKSISIEQVPQSKKQIDNQKSKVTPVSFSQQSQRVKNNKQQNKSVTSFDLKRLAMQHQQEIYSLLVDKVRHNGVLEGDSINVYLPGSNLRIIPMNEFKTNKTLSTINLKNPLTHSNNENGEKNVSQNFTNYGLNKNKQELSTIVYRRANKLFFKTKRPKTAKI